VLLISIYKYEIAIRTTNKVPTTGFFENSLKLNGKGLAPMFTFLLVAILE
jgi:hypothetical protein